MLISGQQLIGKNIISMRIGRAIGVTTEIIINPNNLKIEGWFAQDLDTKKTVILLSQDVRGFVEQGFAVNDHDALSDPDELIRLKELLKLNFTLIGKIVVTDHRRRVGKVVNYSLNDSNFYIQKLNINQSILKNFSGGEIIVDRSQILEITDSKIRISEATAQDSAPMPAIA